jgi:hypothetical protein
MYISNKIPHKTAKCNKIPQLIIIYAIKALKKVVMNMGIALHNKLPTNIMEIEKIKEFKRELRSYLLQHIHYSIDEYAM